MGGLLVGVRPIAAVARWLRSASTARRRPAPPPECELEEKFVRGSGPGGQAINKTNSAVQLRHTPTGLMVRNQATRSLLENRRLARARMAELLDNLRLGDASWSATRAATKQRKSASADKKKRRKYRRLDEAQQRGESAVDDDDDEATAGPAT